MAKAKVRKTAKKAKIKSSSYAAFDFSPGFWRRHWRQGLIILLIAFGLYWMSLSYGYVLDDKIVITDNAFTKKGFSGIWDIFSTESFSGYFGEQKNLVAGARYRPLSIVTFAIEQSVFGDNTFLRHFINILLYGLCGLVIFRVLAILIPSKENNWMLAIPFLASVLYMFHPVHSEVVANIKGRDEIMTAIGALGALYFALLYLKKRNMLWLIGSGVSMFFGLMSKENAITFLAVIPLTMYFFSKPAAKDYMIALVPSLIATILYLVIRTNVIGYFFDSGVVITDLMNDPFIGMTGGERMATIIYTLGIYLKLLIFPHPLTHDYYPYHIPIMHFGKAGTLISLAIYAGLAFAFFALWKKKSAYAWAIGFFIITLSIVSNFLFPVGTFMNERFLFIPSIAFSLVTAWALYHHGFTSPRPLIKYASFGLLAVLLGGYAFKTYVRVPAWKDALSLNSQAALYSPNSARANSFMATALYELGRDTQDPVQKKQYFDEAEVYVRRAIEIYPTYLAANQMLSGIVAERYQRDGNLDLLLQEFEKILDAKPQTEYVYQFCEYLQKRAPVDKMTDFYYKVAYENMALKKQAYPWALQYLKLAEKIAPNDPRILFALGRTLYLGGDQVQGSAYLNRAYQLNPALRALNE